MNNRQDISQRHKFKFQIETIGDAYVVASGVPEPNDHSAMAAAVMAVCMILVVETVELEFLESPVLCRIGKLLMN